MPDLSRYADYVEHPRYGRGPRFTPVTRRAIWETIRNAHRNLEPLSENQLFQGGYVDGTYVFADWRRQTPSTFHSVAYADVDCRCEDCGRRFLWFAEEQKYWFEELKFELWTSCVRCVECRQTIQREKELAVRYARNAAGPGRAGTPDDLLAGAAAGVRLIEWGAFGPKVHQRIRAALNRLSANPGFASAADRLRQRLNTAEQRRETPA